MNVLVDDKKVLRAKEIVGFLSGIATKTDEEARLKDKFVSLIGEDKVDKKDLLEYVYTKLGGLVRTEAEHKVAKAKAAKIKEDWDKKDKKAKGKLEEDN